MEAENLIGVYLKLLSVLECPVCLDYLTKPVAVCNEGHALCSKCKSNITSCPMCRNPISSTRGLILDQIIETLLYPCYKMGCGSLLKRRDAENHDLNCSYENASDKQAVLHNNLLKNIEENFASFIVQPEVVKETRTVGTVTGKVKTADALVQTAAPFSSSLLFEKLNSSTPPGCSSSFSGHPKAVSTPGISISSINQCANSNFKNDFPFLFPQTPVFGQNGFTFSINADNYNSTNLPNMFQFSKDLSYEFSPGHFQNISGFSKNNPVFDANLKPFTFTASVENNSEDILRNKCKKPSTNLSFTMESGASNKKCEQPGASNSFFIRNQDVPSSDLSNLSSDSLVNNCIASSSSSPGLFAPTLSVNDSSVIKKTPQNKPSTNLISCSTSVNTVSSDNGQPFVHSGSIITPTQRKRPTTNLCGLTTIA